MEDSKQVIAALEEAIEVLQEDNSRHRRAINIQRLINKNLRAQLAIAHQNDEIFKEACTSGTYETAEDGSVPVEIEVLEKDIIAVRDI